MVPSLLLAQDCDPDTEKDCVEVLVAQNTLPTPDCNKVIQDCNDALAKCDQTISAYKNLYTTTQSALNDCMAQNNKLSVDLHKAQEGRDAWFRQPVTMVAIGLVVGVLATAYLIKK